MNMTQQTDRRPMPKPFRVAILGIMEEIAPVIQGETGQDGERTFSYAGADDVFQAVQKPLAKHKLIIEMDVISSEVIIVQRGITETGEPIFASAIQMQFQPVLTHLDEDECYCPRTTLTMYAPYENRMSTSAAMITIAEKTYLRALLKLPTTKAEKEEAAALGVSEAAAQASAAPTVSVNLDRTASAQKREEICAEMQIAADEQTTKPLKIGAVLQVWKQRQAEYARLAAPDQKLVREKQAALTNSPPKKASAAA
jgi:hypothetical protein